MTKVDVSVIVPVYNVEKYLDKCLKSLVNQKFDNYEIIVVNDGSPDNSQIIIDEYVEKYPNKVFGYKKENGGLSSARNYGINKSSGTFIVFVDSDDYVTNDYISCLYEEAINNNSDVVICDICQTFEDREEIIVGKREFNGDNIKDFIISSTVACNKLYKKNLFIDNNIFYPDRIYYEDLATISRILVKAKNISYVNKPLYYYVQRDNSIMNQTKYNPKTLDIFKSLSVLTTFFVDNGYYDLYKEEIEYLYITHLLHDYVLRVYRYKEGRIGIRKAIKVIKNDYSTWYRNKYFKKESLKYKIVCYLIYFDMIGVLKLILK